MAQILTDEQEQIARRAKLLRLSAVSLAENMRNGNFKSVYRGQGIEFSDIREYQLGDNVRAIDWNVTARMGRAYIKQYDEDREISIFLIIDKSLSMFSGSSGKSRLETAVEAASLLVMAGELNSASIGAVLFDGEVKFSCSPKSGRERAMTILSKLNRLDDKIAKGSVLENAITGAHKILKKRSMVFVLSDFRVSGWEFSLATLAQKHDVVALRISDPMDSELPKIGSISFVDTESDNSQILPTTSLLFQRAWFEENRQRVDLWKDFCMKHGIYCDLLSTADDVARVLLKVFSSR